MTEEVVPKALYDRLLRFYEIDVRPCGGSEVFYFHPGLNEFDQPIQWTRTEINDQEQKVIATRIYQPLPIDVDGIEYDAKGGRLPRPKLSVADQTGRLGRLLRGYKDLNGAIFTHRMVWGRFIDAVNFRDGNSDANPAFEFPKEIYIFERKLEDISGVHIIWETVSALELTGQRAPGRNYNATICTHPYRGTLCGYMGASMFDVNDKPTTDPLKDECGRRLKSCECRFGVGCELRAHIFPGVQLITQG